MIALVTDKLRECTRVLERHGASVVRWSRADFDAAALPAIWETTEGPFVDRAPGVAAALRGMLAGY